LRIPLTIITAILLTTSVATAQGLNKIVFGPLEGDQAGVLTVHNGENIEIEMWVRTDPENPTFVVGLYHGLLSEDAIIASRNGVEINPDYDVPNWEQIWVDGPYYPDTSDNYPIPPGYTCEMQVAIWCIFFPPCENPLDTQGEWDYYGAFLMSCNTGIPPEETYYPFSAGWYPHSGQGTVWYFDNPPGGSVTPDQDYCGLYFESEISIDPDPYIPNEFSLAQNRPNPFNATTLFQYDLTVASDVTVDIYDPLGRRVDKLVDARQGPGRYSIKWNAGRLSSGLYFYRISAGDYVETRSCVFIK
jgi:hypothetical protein